MLLLTLVNACPWFSVLCALLLRMPLLLTQPAGLATYVPAVSWMSQWYHLLDSVFCRTHLFGFVVVVVLSVCFCSLFPMMK